jgi:hypothetical protein
MLNNIILTVFFISAQCSPFSDFTVRTLQLPLSSTLRQSHFLHPLYTFPVSSLVYHSQSFISKCTVLALFITARSHSLYFCIISFSFSLRIPLSSLVHLFHFINSLVQYSYTLHYCNYSNFFISALFSFYSIRHHSHLVKYCTVFILLISESLSL